MERLADDFEIHLYSSRVEDLDLSKVTWHRVSVPPAPHLIRYLWFLTANSFSRWRDRRFRGLVADILYSPGVNCLKPDVVSVHALFSNVRRKLANSLALRNNSITAWPVVLHRRIYYRLAEYLEGDHRCACEFCCRVATFLGIPLREEDGIVIFAPLAPTPPPGDPHER